MAKKSNKDEFELKAMLLDVVYDLSEFEYINSATKSIVIDPVYGKFEVSPNNLLRGRKHKKRSQYEKNIKNLHKRKENFIVRASKTHNNFYQYHLVNYVNNTTPVEIYDPYLEISFWQIPANHANGQGNPAYTLEKISKAKTYSFETYVDKANAIHSYLYTYIKFGILKNGRKSIIYSYNNIIHEQDISSHLVGNGHPALTGLKLRSAFSKELGELQKECDSIYGPIYDLSDFVYVNSHTPGKIYDKELNEYFWKTPTKLVHAKQGNPSRYVGESSCISRDIDKYFDEFEREKKFDDLHHKGSLRYDRYIPYLNILLEYDGSQHFDENHVWHTDDGIIRDKIKTEYAIKNGYNFIRIAYYEDHVQALESFLALVLKHQDKQIVQIYGEVQFLDKK